MKELDSHSPEVRELFDRREHREAKDSYNLNDHYLTDYMNSDRDNMFVLVPDFLDPLVLHNQKDRAVVKEGVVVVAALAPDPDPRVVFPLEDQLHSSYHQVHKLKLLWTQLPRIYLSLLYPNIFNS